MLFPAVLFAIFGSAGAVQISLCSPMNLGTEIGKNAYMSNGWCSDRCREAGYAAAITQFYTCWCSNSIPADKVPISSCDYTCPGYSEKCGGDGVYGYIVLSSVSTVSSDRSSSAISSSSDESTTSTSKSTSSDESLSTQLSMLVCSSMMLLLESFYSPCSTLVSTQSTLITANPLVSTALYLITVVSVETVGGSTSQFVSTKFITEIASSSSLLLTRKSSFFDSKAKVAGTFTAVGGVVIALVATVIYCCCFGGGHGYKYSGEENLSLSDESYVAPEKNAPLHTSNELSKASLPVSNNQIKRNRSSKSIRSLLSAIGTGTGGADAANVNRNSSKKKLNSRSKSIDMRELAMFPISEFDNLLEPNKTYTNSNQSRRSIGDEHDYSRRILQVANP